jgi:hypothetical protein
VRFVWPGIHEANRRRLGLKTGFQFATGLKDAGAALDIDTQASMSGLPGVRDSIEKAWKAAEETKTRGQAAAGAIQVASAPPQVTREILQAMVKTIANGPNIGPIGRFRAQTRKAHQGSISL